MKCKPFFGLCHLFVWVALSVVLVSCDTLTVPVVAPPTASLEPAATSIPVPIESDLMLRPYQQLPETTWPDLPIDELHDQIFAALLRRNPELATELGLSQHYGVPQDTLTDISDSYRLETFVMIERYLDLLMGVEIESLTPAQYRSNQLLIWDLETQLLEREFLYYNYPVRQLISVHDLLPALMANDHPVNTAADVEDFLARLRQFPTKFEQASTLVETRREQGILPPRFVFDQVTGQLSQLISQPALDSQIYTGFAGRLDQANDFSDAERAELKAAVQLEIEDSVLPAYETLRQHLFSIREEATTDDGVWKFPNGEQYYAYTLRMHTTTDLSAAEIHAIGLAEVERIQAEIEAGLKELGYSGDLAADGRQFFFDGEIFTIGSDDDRAAVIAQYTERLAQIEADVGHLFTLIPQSPLEIRRVPPFQESGSPAYYSPPPLDGSRSGIFFVPLSEGRSIPADGMMTLAAHEGYPGHHYQLALQNELTALPIFRRVARYTSYTEGWALYTERLIDEQGLYDDNPRARLARLVTSELFRAARLVVDTGIHGLGWSRAEARAYMQETFGFDYASEIDRYIVWPGQATGYKIGELTFLRLREEAQAALGDRFDLAEFHTVVLENGNVPLLFLEEIVDEYVAQKLSK